jgi:hypothetical protein
MLLKEYAKLKNRWKIATITLACICIALGSLLVLSLSRLPNALTETHIFNSSPRVSGGVYFVFQMWNGTYTYYEPDLITTVGEQYDAEIFYNASAIDGGTALTGLNETYFSYGNATVATSLTQLTQEASNSGFARSLPDSTPIQWLNGGHYAMNFTHSATCTANITLNVVGIQWSGVPGSNNNLYAAFPLPQSTLFRPNDVLNATWLRTANSAGN